MFNLHKHHIFKGIRNRNKSEEDGLWVYLCFLHHEGTNGVHGKNGKELDERLKRTAEKIWLETNQKKEEDFIKRYGRNYL
jgi:hypothetical protein